MSTNFNTTFEVTNDVLGVSFNNEETQILSTDDGLLTPIETLYDFNLSGDGTLSAVDRVGDLPNNPLAKLWIGLCTIYEYRDVIDEATYQTTQRLVPALVNEPCRLSYNREQATNISNGAAVVSQSITLFIRPDLVIKPGSVIEITQHGVTERYNQRFTATTKRLFWNCTRITHESHLGL